MTYTVYLRKNQDGLFDIFRDGKLTNASVKKQELEDQIRSHGIFEDFLLDVLRRLKKLEKRQRKCP